MSLDIVRPADIPLGKVMYVKDYDRSLITEDVARAQPTYDHLRYLNKPDFSVGCTEPTHVGARARTYYPPMDRKVRDLSLTTADIELAQPRAHRQRGNRHTDPVCPNYTLPSCYVRESTPPRHNGRITNDISDIEMTRPKKVIPDRNYVRDPNDCSDIEYASVNYAGRTKREAPGYVRQDRQHDVTDITGLKNVPLRETNPLDPVNRVPTHASTSLHTLFAEEVGQGMCHAQRDAERVGPILGSKPRKLQWDNGEPQFSLLREDIPGAMPQRWVGCVPANIYDAPEVRPPISFHDPHDIPGAQVGSLKKGIEGATRRRTNPLNPHYTMLDGEIRPQPAPAMYAERGLSTPGTGYSHPLLQNRAASSSEPNLQRSQFGQTPAQGQYLQRDLSLSMLRSNGGRDLVPGGGSRPSRTPSYASTPVGASSPMGLEQGQPAWQGGQAPQRTLRLDEEPLMSMRSSGSNRY